MNKKFISLLLGATMVSSIIVGCGSDTTDISNTSAVSENDKKEDLEPMQFRIGWDVESGRGQAIKAIVDVYNEQTDGRTVEVVSGNNQVEDIMTSEAEIMQLEYFTATSLGQEGYFYDLSDDFNNISEFFSPAVIDMVSVDDEMYGVPWLGHTLSFIYNKDLLDLSGVNPDEITSWEKFEEALLKVEENTDAKGMGMIGKQMGDLSWMTAMFVHSFGGSLIDETGNIGLDSKESKEGLDFYFNTLGKYGQEGWQEHTGVEVMEAFRTQKIAFEIQGPWGVTDIWKLPEEQRFNVGTLALSQIMHGEYKGAAEASVHPIAISTLVEDEDLLEDAKDFIRFMITPEAQEMLMAGEFDEKTGEYYPFRVPIRNDLQNSPYFIEHPEFLAFIQGFENPSIEVPVPEWTEIRERYLTAGYSAVANGSKTIDEAVSEIIKMGNPILQD
ncbi:hypothetical protein AN644_03825 [Candidatus Epulonipiscium fishelsonii]|nr:hypothetical protein AN644_03825 [Epulopiscium sp. SCG-C06WGA-EpuloA1]